MARKIVVRGTSDQQKRAGLVDVAGAGDSSMRSLRRVMDAPKAGAKARPGQAWGARICGSSDRAGAGC